MTSTAVNIPSRYGDDDLGVEVYAHILGIIGNGELAHASLDLRSRLKTSLKLSEWNRTDVLQYTSLIK